MADMFIQLTPPFRFNALKRILYIRKLYIMPYVNFHTKCQVEH